MESVKGCSELFSYELVRHICTSTHIPHRDREVGLIVTRVVFAQVILFVGRWEMSVQVYQYTPWTILYNKPLCCIVYVIASK